MAFLPPGTDQHGRQDYTGRHRERRPSPRVYQFHGQRWHHWGLLRPAFSPVRPVFDHESGTVGGSGRGQAASGQHPATPVACGAGLPGSHLHQAQERRPCRRRQGQWRKHHGGNGGLRDRLLADEGRRVGRVDAVHRRHRGRTWRPSHRRRH